MIEAQGLTKKFGDVTAVDSLTFEVKDGEVFGFLGPNGAGKTTTIRMLCCLISKTSGSAKVAGYDIGNEADTLKIRRLIGLVPDNVGLYEGLTAYDNLDFYGKIYGCSEEERRENIEYFLKMLGLWERRADSAGNFSKGMKQKLAIARALIHNPALLVLDEPTANLDPESAKTVRDFLLGLKKEKKTIFLNTHNLDEAQRICDRIGILNTRMMAIGTPAELESSIRGKRVVVQLKQVTQQVIEAVAGLSLKAASEGNQLSVETADPEGETPRIMRAIVLAGGEVQAVTTSGSSLEDAYLQLVKEGKA
jgi:ABC-2 type transport system ATP-binding protein